MRTSVKLRLYVAGRTVSAEGARAAVGELERIIAAKLGPGAIATEIIDALASPEIAARDQVFATPTLVRLSPGPTRRLFGDLSRVEKIIAALDIPMAPSYGAILELPDCDALAGVA